MTVCEERGDKLPVIQQANMTRVAKYINHSEGLGRGEFFRTVTAVG